MPVEIRELIVRAVVSSEELSSSVSGGAAGESHHEKMITEALEQLKRMMLDSKER
jgi:Family of unknown function (DUF5908)